MTSTPRTWIRSDERGTRFVLRAVWTAPRPGFPSGTPSSLREAYELVRAGLLERVSCTR